MKQHRIAAAALVALALACTPEKAPQSNVSVKVDAVTSRFVVTRIALDVQPAGIQKDLAYDPSYGTYGETLTVPVGMQTFTATAWAGTEQVGAGSVTVEVVESRTALVRLSIFDSTGPLPVPDHGPIITSLVVPRSTVELGEAVTLSATAIDPDADPLAFEWRLVSCAGGTLTNPLEPTATFSGTVAETCTVELSVRSKDLADVEAFTIVVGQAYGDVGLSGRFVEQPVIRTVMASVGNPPCTLDRMGSNASCPDAATPSQSVVVDFQWDVQQVPWQVVPALTDDCGGYAYPLESGSGYARFAWTAPSVATVCLLSPSVTSRSLVDTFPFAIAVGGCIDDPYEQNDTKDTAAWLYYWGGSGELYANDDDWFQFQPTMDGRWEIRATGAPVWIELWGNEGRTLVSSAMNLGTFNAVTGATYFARIVPDATATACSAPYYLSIGPPCVDSDHDGWFQNCGMQPDCNDWDPNVNPGAAEVCWNFMDDNCNGSVDDYWVCQGSCTDADGDGWYRDCGAQIDCNDMDPGVNPGMAELCGNGLDENCNAYADEPWVCGPTCVDMDADGFFGNCDPLDCNDADASVSPAMPEVCGNVLDDNCNGSIDEPPFCAP